jgi:hypothetical protein
VTLVMGPAPRLSLAAVKTNARATDVHCRSGIVEIGQGLRGRLERNSLAPEVSDFNLDLLGTMDPMDLTSRLARKALVLGEQGGAQPGETAGAPDLSCTGELHLA